jgi:hypothetical protein
MLLALIPSKSLGSCVGILAEVSTPCDIHVFVGDAFGVHLTLLRHTHCPDRAMSCADSMGSTIKIYPCGGGDHRPEYGLEEEQACRTNLLRCSWIAPMREVRC